MGLPSYVVVATMKAVLAQRLARKLCDKCKQAYDPSPAEAQIFRDNGVALPTGAKLAEGNMQEIRRLATALSFGLGYPLSQ